MQCSDLYDFVGLMERNSPGPRSAHGDRLPRSYKRSRVPAREPHFSLFLHVPSPRLDGLPIFSFFPPLSTHHASLVAPFDRRPPSGVVGPHAHPSGSSYSQFKTFQRYRGHQVQTAGQISRPDLLRVSSGPLTP